MLWSEVASGKLALTEPDWLLLFGDQEKVFTLRLWLRFACFAFGRGWRLVSSSGSMSCPTG